MTGRQIQQGCRIIGTDIFAQFADDCLITAHFHIPACQDKGCPNKGIEPVNGQCQKTKSLENMVCATDMVPLMGNDEGSLPGFQRSWQIDRGTENTHHKGGVNVIRNEDSLSVRNHYLQFTT